MQSCRDQLARACQSEPWLWQQLLHRSTGLVLSSGGAARLLADLLLVQQDRVQARAFDSLAAWLAADRAGAAGGGPTTGAHIPGVEVFAATARRAVEACFVGGWSADAERGVPDFWPHASAAPALRLLFSAAAGEGGAGMASARGGAAGAASTAGESEGVAAAASTLARVLLCKLCDPDAVARSVLARGPDETPQRAQRMQAVALVLAGWVAAGSDAAADQPPATQDALGILVGLHWELAQFLRAAGGSCGGASTRGGCRPLHERLSRAANHAATATAVATISPFPLPPPPGDPPPAQTASR